VKIIMKNINKLVCVGHLGCACVGQTNHRCAPKTI